MDEIRVLIEKAEEFLEKELYNEVIKILPDELLDKHRNADLYLLRSKAHRKLKEFDIAFTYVNKGLEVDPENSSGYFILGNILYDKNEYEKTIEAFTKVIKIKSNSAFAYINRGLAWRQKGEYDKAIEDYDKAIELKPDHANSFNSKGYALDDKGEYDKAIEAYSRAIELQEDFPEPYNNRGVSWANIENYDQAIADYTKAIELRPNYARAFSNRGDAFYQNGDFQKALKDYQKAIELDNGFTFLEYNIKLALEKLEERKILEASKAQPNDKDEKIEIENKIVKAINIIKEAAKSEVKTVVHYTKVFVADIYLKNKQAKMYYSNAIYMNDPMEGKIFFEYLSDKTIEAAYLNGEKRTETSVYLGSFLPAEENDGEISHEDELVMWRTYGKDENGKEAAGCSVVLSSDFFKVKTIEKEESSANDISEELLNVVYIKNQKHSKKITNDSKGKIETAIKSLKDQLKKLIKLRNKYKPKDDFYKDIENTIFKQLSTVSYLFKSADYDFEHEVRVITYMPRNSDTIKYREISEPNTPHKRFYIESYNDILPYIKRIYLGPKVEHYQQWSLYFDYEIRQRAKELELITSPPYQIKPSDIEIMKSECKFQ